MKYLFFTALLLVCGCQSGLDNPPEKKTHEKRDPTWPSPNQIQSVKDRINSFPRETLVSSVNWYEPLVTVDGGSGYTISKELADDARWKEAIALAEQHKSHALLVWQNGALKLEKYWSGFNENSLFDTASMHKTVVALLTGVAVKNQLIPDIEAPLSDFLSELKGTDRAHIPLKSILEMSSGLQSPPYDNSPAGSVWQTYLGDDLWQAILRWPVKNEPYQNFYYANANPQYLGWVLERVSNKTYADYLSEALWKPLGAKNARVWLDQEHGATRTSCCLQASAEDWLRIGLLILNKGKVGDQQLVEQKWINNMIAPSETNPNYGWQIWLGSPHLPSRSYNKDTPFSVPAAKPFIANDVAYLDGSGGQRVYIIPSENTVIVRIGKPSPTWDDSALPNLVLKNSIK